MSNENDRSMLPDVQPHSQLFTLRLWRDTEPAQETVPFIQVRHVLTGEIRYFSAWSPLIDYVTSRQNTPLVVQEPKQTP